jgi:ATP-dependent Clp endopeptidase proteolytic subunit ClpP
VKVHLQDASFACSFEPLIHKRNVYELRAKSKKEADIIMYGSISEWGKVRSEDFIRAIGVAKSAGYEKVNLKVNSPGGSIFEGIAIVTNMNDPEIVINATIEGMAASMASVFIQGAKTRRIAQHARMMVHQGAGGVFGSANTIRNYADLLDSLNKTIAEIYAQRTKKPVQWILDNWMPEGKDKWFTAKEALDAGLVDEIVPGDAKPLPKEDASMSLIEMAAHYSETLSAEIDNNNDNNEPMKKEELIALLGLKADATDAEIKAAAAAMKAKADSAKTDTAKNNTKSDPEESGKGANEDKDVLVKEVIAMARKKGVTDEARLKSIEKVAKIDISAAMEMLPEDGAKSDTLETDTTKVNELIKSLKDGKNGGGSASASKKDWDYDEYEKHPAAFAALLKDNPKEYIRLFNAKFGYEPTEAELRGFVFVK